MVIYCEVTYPLKLWDEYWELMSDYILYILKHILGVQNLQMPQTELQNHVLFEIESLFNKSSSSLSHYKLPIPTRLIFDDLSNRLLREELDYNRDDLLQEHIELFDRLNDERRIIYNVVVMIRISGDDCSVISGF